MSGMGYQYKSIFDAVRVIISQEGVKGMYKGIVPNLLKVAPSMASSWLSFEMTRDFLLTLKAETSELWGRKLCSRVDFSHKQTIAALMALSAGYIYDTPHSSRIHILDQIAKYELYMKAIGAFGRMGAGA